MALHTGTYNDNDIVSAMWALNSSDIGTFYGMINKDGKTWIMH